MSKEEELFHKLWVACQGMVDCVDSLDEDRKFGDKSEQSAYPTTKKSGLGKEFAVFNARRKLSFQDLEAFKAVVDEIVSLGYNPEGLLDKRKMKPR